MKEYGKIKPSLLIASMVAVVLAGAFVSAIPILQQKVNAQPSGGMVYVPGVGWTGGNGNEAPDQRSTFTYGPTKESDTSGLHTIVPALKSSPPSNDASKK